MLTAAHCVINLLGSPTKVRLGSIDIGGNRQNVQDYNIVNTTVNREYNYRTKLHDIALIRIDKDVQFDNNTYPACLYTKTNDPPNMIATGWGATDISKLNNLEKISFLNCLFFPDERQRSNILLRQTFYPIPIKECGKSYVNYNKPIVESQICAYQNNSDTCKVIYYKQIGIVKLSCFLYLFRAIQVVHFKYNTKKTVLFILLLV